MGSTLSGPITGFSLICHRKTGVKILPVRERRMSAPASLLSGDESRWLLTLWLR